MRIAPALLAAITLFSIGGCACPMSSGLIVLGGEPVVYQCENGLQIVARYYSLSDGSLNFAKVKLPDGKEFTLPNVLSASGARYTNEVEKVWWTKGDSAFLQARDRNGEWRTEYDNCRENHQK